ncbi:MAG: PDZ domain-containing protein [Verrucomicrobiota bacterium]|nr:PDZ domain-containing protein [Verrucomicrobiota bacterium]
MKPRPDRQQMRKFLLVATLFAAIAIPSATAAEKAWYGFHIRVETAGFVLNPIVRSVKIDKVASNSPASAQSIRVGDAIVEADGAAVPGARALQLWPILSKQPGDTLRLRLQRPDGETYAAVVTGISKPVR